VNSRFHLARRHAVALGAGITAIVIVLVALIVVSNRGGSNSADPKLKRAADAVLPILNHPGNKLPVSDTSLRSFQAWFYDLQLPFLKAVKGVPRDQFIQVLAEDPNTFPPQLPVLNTSAHPTVYVDAAAAAKVTQSNTPLYTSVSQNHQSFRVYLTPLAIPQILRSAGMSGILEVFTKD
jgi:hypothetical protein